MESICTNLSLWLPSIIAVVASTIAVVAIICQSKAMAKQLKLQNYIEYTKRYQEIVLNFPETVNKKDFDMEKLDTDVRNKTMRYMRAYYDLCFEEFDLKSKGFVGKKMWETWKAGMEFAFSKTAFQQAWEKIKQDTEYNDEFNKLVNDGMKNTHKNI